jgi:hypothetical protein
MSPFLFSKFRFGATMELGRRTLMMMLLLRPPASAMTYGVIAKARHRKTALTSLARR